MVLKLFARSCRQCPTILCFDIVVQESGKCGSCPILESMRKNMGNLGEVAGSGLKQEGFGGSRPTVIRAYID